MALTIALVLAAALAVASDIRTRRIPNALTVTALGLALLFRAPAGWEALGSGLAGAAIAFLLVFPLFVFGGFGGGDAKLLTAMGAFLGLEALFPALVAIGILGLALSFFEMARQRAIVRTLVNVGRALRKVALVPLSMLHPSLHARLMVARAGERLTVQTEGAVTVPYGVAIGIGAVIGWFISGGIT